LGKFTELPDGDTIIEHTGTGTILQDLGKLKEDQYYVTVSGTVTIGDTTIDEFGNDTGNPLQPGFIATGPIPGYGLYPYSGVSIMGEVTYLNHTTDVALPFEMPPDPANGDTTRTKFDPYYGYNVRNISAVANQPANRIQPGGTYEISGKVPLEVWSERSTYPGQATLSLDSDYGVTWVLTDDDGNPRPPESQYYHPLSVTFTDLKMSISNNSRMRPE